MIARFCALHTVLPPQAPPVCLPTRMTYPLVIRFPSHPVFLHHTPYNNSPALILILILILHPRLRFPPRPRPLLSLVTLNPLLLQSLPGRFLFPRGLRSLIQPREQGVLVPLKFRQL